MLTIDNLHLNIDEKPILKGLNLSIKPGEVHAIMGPNGAGKSTLSNALTGRSGYVPHEGHVSFDGQDLLEMAPEERAQQGVFLAFQYPCEIPGVNNAYFLRMALNQVRKARGDSPLDAVSFMRLAREKMKQLNMDPSFLKRNVNEGFSGGEKKRNEVLQMLLLEPKLMILDETDSGLDIDALRTVAEGVNQLRSPQRSMLVITHYQRLLGYIVPDVVHVLADGKIIQSGDRSLALELESNGYGAFA